MRTAFMEAPAGTRSIRTLQTSTMCEPFLYHREHRDTGDTVRESGTDLWFPCLTFFSSTNHNLKYGLVRGNRPPPQRRTARGRRDHRECARFHSFVQNSQDA